MVRDAIMKVSKLNLTFVHEWLLMAGYDRLERRGAA